MTYAIESFAAECRMILTADPGPAGREKVRNLLEEALADKAFVMAHLGPHNTNPKTTLYEDPDLGFCILAHVLSSVEAGKPHDHGASWAIYGQAAGSTEMTEWRRTGSKDVKGAEIVEPGKAYPLNPGMVTLYNEGVVHSTKRDDETRLIRITGCDLDNIPRGRYRAVHEAVAA